MRESLNPYFISRLNFYRAHLNSYGLRHGRMTISGFVLLQVSAGQHMQLTGDLKPVVSVAAQQGMYFNQQQTQNQAGPSANQADTYCSVSQSQTINFTQQSLRQRAAAAAAGGVPQPGAAGPGTRGHPQQVVPPNQVDQHHAKLLQQQQLMRAQVSNLIFLARPTNFRLARVSRRKLVGELTSRRNGALMVTRVGVRAISRST